MRRAIHLFGVLALVACGVAAADQEIVRLTGAVTLQVPSGWRLLNEKQIAEAGSKVTRAVSAAGVEIDLKLGERVIYVPTSPRATANISIVVRSAERLPFRSSDFKSAGMPSQKVVEYFKAQDNAFSKLVETSGGKVLDRFPIRTVVVGNSMGVEYGSMYQQASGITVSRQVILTTGERSITVTVSYLKEAETQYGSLFEDVRSSVRIP